MPVIKDLDNYLQTLQQLPPFKKELRDIPNELYKLDIVDIDETIPFGSEPIKILGSLNVGPDLYVYNDPNDNRRDENEEIYDILSSTSEEEEVVIVPDYANNAYIKYGLFASIKTGVDYDPLDFSFSANAKFRVDTYKKHSNSKSLLESARMDLGNFQWIFSLKDLKELKEEEACTLEFAGDLKSSIELSWSDLYSGSLMGISRFIKLGTPLAIDIDAGLSVGFNLEIKDDFLLVVKKTDGDKYEIGVKKNKYQSLAMGGNIGVSASISGPDIDKLVDGLLEKLYDLGKEKTKDLFENSSIGDLTDEQLQSINKIAKALGISKPGEELQHLKDKWNDVVEKVKKTIKTIVESKVEAGVRFEYGQIKTNSCFMIAEFTEDILTKYHTDLLKFKVNQFLDKQEDGLLIKRFLLEKTIKRSRGFGMKLKIANKGVGVEHGKEVEFIERKNKNGDLQVVSSSERSRDDKWFDDSFSWSGDLMAETEGFVKGPKIDDLNFSLNLGFEWEEGGTLRKRKARKIVDAAALWGMIDHNKVSDVRKYLRKELSNAEDIKISVSMNVPHAIFKELLRTIDKVKNNNPKSYNSLFAKAMAACMEPGKESIDERIKNHGKYFLLYLRGTDPNHPAVQRYSGYIGSRHFKSLDNSIQIILNRGNEAYSRKLSTEIFKGFNKFHNNIYRLKVLGYIMHYYANIIGQANDIETVFQVSYKKDGQKKIKNFFKT
ncbi:hypothetical protein [Carboxylicivirga sp. RSCT41]|uniref:hypothetical protein n=1 Tax=Carboxylicivirga agarovorans TaxID=3417570 RepID=UPI003D340B6D